MKSFERILVPVDFSKHSERAVRVAAELARRYGGALEIIHVYDPVAYALPGDYSLFTAQQLDALCAEFERRLAAMKDLARASGVSQVKTHLRRGPCATSICELAREGAFDLIVMGTHGRSGLSRLLLGSVAERVLRSAPCPVLTVKGEESPGSSTAAQASAGQLSCCS
jgi:nucleotide-binding universal stress UspA family protein